MSSQHPPQSAPRLAILGTRGIPARYGGFETFAEHLALYLVERGWNIEVHCPASESRGLSAWRGVRLRSIPVSATGALGTIEFDFKSTLIAARHERLVLNLGYGTAVFGILLRVAGCRNVVNMDGIEWKRAKWRYAARRWLQANEWVAGRLATHVIADHPGIAAHLSRHVARERMAMIPYGAERVEGVDAEPVRRLGLRPGNYGLIIGRAEPENSILEMVRTFSRATRGRDLAVLGHYDPAANHYQASVLASAGPEVKFLGAIYDKAQVQALRCHAAFYLHGHQVGGTNPSLVEALGAGNPVLAHDNIFNRWVAGPGSRFFADETELAHQIELLCAATPAELQAMSAASRTRHAEAFTWQIVLSQYEELLTRFL